MGGVMGFALIYETGRWCTDVVVVVELEGRWLVGLGFAESMCSYCVWSWWGVWLD